MRVGSEFGWRQTFRKIYIACGISILYAVVPLGGLAQTEFQVGYSVLTAQPGKIVPVGAALFSYTNGAGDLVSQVGVGAATPIRSGRVFVDEEGTQTTIALANPSAQSASVTLTLRDAAGNQVAQQTVALPARQHLARYVSQLFPGQTANLTGSLTFDSDVAVAAITLRESKNVENEPLYTALPVVDMSVLDTNPSLVFPHIVAGEGYTMQLILINRSAQKLRGRVSLVASDGRPLFLRLAGSSVSSFDYLIASQGTYRVELDTLSGLSVGYAVVTPEPGNALPAGSAVFQLKSNGALVTQAGAPAIPGTTSARIFVDYISAQTGVALANPGGVAADVALTLMNRDGMVQASTHRVLSARTQLAIFVHELFPTVADGFTGLLEISSPNPIVPITLQLTTNSRNNLVLTTLPVADLSRPPTSASVVFPQIVFGRGFSTRLILLSGGVNASLGQLLFYQSDGSPMAVPTIVINAATVNPCGVIVSGTVTVSVEVTSDVGVVGLEIKLDGANFGPELTAAPYSVRWDTTAATNGCHLLTAVARDAAENQGTASLNVTVIHP